MTHPRDTAPEAAEAQRGVFRRMTGAERLAIACEMSDELRAVARDGVRDRRKQQTEFVRDEGPRAG